MIHMKYLVDKMYHRASTQSMKWYISKLRQSQQSISTKKNSYLATALKATFLKSTVEWISYLLPSYSKPNCEA